MNFSKYTLAAAVFLLVTAAASVLGAPKGTPTDLQLAHKGTIEIDTSLLNRAEQSEAVKQFFAVARQAFEDNPMAKFADLAPIREAAEKQGLTHLGGPMLGNLSSEGASVWVRTLKPAQVTVLVQLPEGERSFGPVASTADSDLTAVVKVSGLKPAASYGYRVMIDGRAIAVPAGAAITTIPVESVPAKVQIAFGSDFHKTGLWNQSLLAQIRNRGNKAMLLLGDNAADDRDNQVGLHRSDYLLRDLSPGWRGLAASVPVYASWDDHDYFNNDKSGIPAHYTAADRSAVRTVWQQNWNNPATGFADKGEGIFFRTRIGPCDVIMLDTRFFRTTVGEPDSFLGKDQMEWVVDQLAACSGPFIILSGGTMWSDDISNGKDSWGVWDKPGRERLFSLIETKRIPGVLLLSGDRHGARVMRIPRPSGYTFYEFELGSLGAHPGPGPKGAHPDDQPFGLVSQSAFGEFSFDTTVADPTVTMRVISDEGKELYTLTLSRSELTPPGK